MILNSNGKFLIFLVIILIVSITPASASLINESYGNITKANPESLISSESKISDEMSLKAIEQSTDELNSYSDSLKQDSEYAKTRAKDYGWKIWKWPEITIDIIQSLYNMIITANKMTASANKLEDEANKLKSNLDDEGSELEVDADSYINNVNNPKCENDAYFMADELSKSLNTPFVVKEVNASDLKKGDIIQYVSQEKYPRYLTVQEIMNKSETMNKVNTGRQLLDYTPYGIEFCFLRSVGDKIVDAPRLGKVFVIESNGVDTGEILEESVQIQQSEIDKTREKAENLRNTAKPLRTGYITCFTVAGIISAGLVILAALAVFTSIVPPLSGGVVLALVACACLVAILEIVGIELYFDYNSIDKTANGLTKQAGLNEADLNTYTSIVEKPTTFMNITTFDGVPIVKRPPIDNWRDLVFKKIQDPKHGDLLPGPGLQFLYGPYEGYTGEDYFKYQINNKNGETLGYVDVNVTIHPIPVFEVPKEA